MALQLVEIVGDHEVLNQKIRCENLAPLPHRLWHRPLSLLWTLYKTRTGNAEIRKSEPDLETQDGNKMFQDFISCNTENICCLID
jgi:hypothetical protein